MTMTPSSPTVRSRRPYRLGIDAHTEFVAGLVSEMDAAVASGSFDDLHRFVRLLEIIDGPGEQRYLVALSLPEALCQAAKGLDLDIDVRGTAEPEPFLGDPETLRLGVELVLEAFAGDTGKVELGVPNGRVVHVEGPLDLNDQRRVWQLRCGRRVLEGENCRVRLYRVPGAYRLEIRALEP